MGKGVYEMTTTKKAPAFDWDLDEQGSDEADFPVLLCTAY